MLDAHYEAASGIVTTISRGMHSQHDFDEHVRKLLPLLARSRARNEAWLHLVDASAHVVQSSDSTDYIAEVWNTTPDPGGYSAYVVGSFLARFQIRRLQDDSRAAYFDDVTQARDWLIDKASQAAASRPSQAAT